MRVLLLFLILPFQEKPRVDKNNVNTKISEAYERQEFIRVIEIFEINEPQFAPDIYEKVARSYFKEGSNSECITLFKRLLDDQEYSSEAKNSFTAETFIGVSFRRLGLTDSSFLYYQKAYKSAKSGISKKDLGMAIRNLAFLHSKKQQYSQSIVLLHEAIDSHRQERDSLNTMRGYYSIGKNYYSLGILDSALTYTLEAYSYFKKNHDSHWSWETSFWLANIERELKNERALEYYRESLKLAEDNITNKAYSLSGIGESMIASKNDSSIIYLKRALQEAELLNDSQVQAEISLMLTKFYARIKPDTSLLKENLSKSHELVEKRKDKIGYTSAKVYESEYFLLNKKFKESLKSVDTAIDTAQQYKINNKLAAALSQKVRVYQHFGKFEEALLAKEEELRLREKINNDRSEAVYQILRTQNEMDKQESTIANQQLEIDNNNLQILIMYISIALVISALVFIFWQYRTRSKYAQKLETMFLDSRHRYMNNLLLLKNWFNEGKTEKNDEIISFAQNRIDAISTVNRHLDRLSYNKDTIESKSFLEDISHNLLANREFTSEIENVPINMSVSGPLGMITNEIITNGLKYGEEPYAIRFHKNGGGYVLEIEDHGPGIADPEKQGTGSKVLRLLSRQLKGKLNYQNKADHSPEGRGTLVSLNFKG